MQFRISMLPTPQQLLMSKGYGNMKKKIMILWCSILMLCLFVTGCGSSEKQPETETAESVAVSEEETAAGTEAVLETEGAALLEDGTYTADFNTDSSMFRVNEACDGKGTLTVKDGKMTIHISLASKNILNLFSGLAEDAQKDGAELLEPTTDSVTYSDGITEEVYGFDVPVPALDEEFDLAIIGTKGKWYDHKVSVSNPEKTE